MKIKKIIAGTFAVLMIASMFMVSTAFATEPSFNISGSWAVENRNLTNDQHGNYNPMQAYFNYGSWFHDAWVSTEVSVATNGKGYVYAEITDWEGNVRSGEAGPLSPTDGWVKLPAIYGEVNYAQKARFAAKQTTGNITTGNKKVEWQHRS